MRLCLLCFHARDAQRHLAVLREGAAEEVEVLPRPVVGVRVIARHSLRNHKVVNLSPRFIENLQGIK